MDERSTVWAISPTHLYTLSIQYFCVLFRCIILCDPMLCETSLLFLVYMSFIFSATQEKTFKTRLTNYSIIIYG